MTSDNQPLTLMNIPLEVRHHIFKYVAIRDVQPKKLLRYWFEKKEVKEKTAELTAKDPNASAPRVVFEGDQFEHEEHEEHEEEDDSEDDEEGEEDSDEDSDEENEEDGGSDEDEGEEGDEVGDQDGEQVDNEHGDGESDEEMAEQYGDEDAAAEAAQPSPPAPIITAHRKWRHIPQFMRITHCPPPVELLLTSKQMNAEAKNWFYDVAVLRIEATGSFAHTSFFEEAFSQITEAAFSPMEDIRKVEVTFVWDTTWLRSEQADCVGAIFPALLRQRAAFVVRILSQAPYLHEVTIHWHDSAQDEESVDLMNDVLMGLLGLNADVKVKMHYTTADAKPYRKSIVGRRRVEFQNIVNNGLDRLF